MRGGCQQPSLVLCSLKVFFLDFWCLLCVLSLSCFVYCPIYLPLPLSRSFSPSSLLVFLAFSLYVSASFLSPFFFPPSPPFHYHYHSRYHNCSNVLHQQSFQTLVGRYERANGRVRDLVASAEVANAKLAAMQIRMDYFEEKTDTELARVDAELARVAAAPTNGVVETQYLYNLNM